MFLQASIDHPSNRFDLSLPAEVSLDGKGKLAAARFGDLHLLDRLGLDVEPSSSNYFEAFGELVGCAGVQRMHRTNLKGCVIGFDDVIVKFSHTANVLKEAIATIAVDQGLAATIDDAFRPRVPRVLAGTTTRSCGILLLERFVDYEPVLNFSGGAQAAFVEGKPDRLEMYRNALNHVGFTDYSSVRDSSLDDNVTNTLWPSSFHEFDDGQTISADMVRVDFGEVMLLTDDLIVELS